MSDPYTMAASEYEILYVDDEEMALKYFRRAMGKAFTVHTATDAQAGLDILAEHGDNIGLLVSDQRMPTETGVELLKKVRKRWPHVVRILTTAYADLEDAIEAVNRGEIFRYITKPWDIDTLRTEVGQAMDLFRLRHEHAQLMREKMNVWQRLVQLGRLRDLVVMSGSFLHLRHSQNAIAEYLNDHLTAPDTGSLVAPGQLDLWQLTESEINQTLAFADDIIGRTAALTRRDELFDTTLEAGELQQLVSQAFPRLNCPVDSNLPTVRVAQEPARLMLQALATSINSPMAEALLQPALTDDGVLLIIPLPGKPKVNSLTADTASNLLTAYLLAFHHGGQLSLQADNNQYSYALTLPTQPTAKPQAPPQSGWLKPLLVRLEGWD